MLLSSMERRIFDVFCQRQKKEGEKKRTAVLLHINKEWLYKKKGEPEMEGIIVVLIYSLVCGFVSKAINNNRGKDGGFWWGFFLGVIGIVVVAVRPKD